MAVVQDLRKREVANWWNFSLIAVILAYRGFVSVSFQNYWYFLHGLIGFGIFFVLANLFYYGRVFAGGDAKLLMGVGAVLPFSVLFSENLIIFVYFLILLLFCGSIYGLVFSAALAYRNLKNFGKEFLIQFHKSKAFFPIFIFLAILVLILVLFIKIYILVWFSLIAILFPFLYIYAKSIEESCMIKALPASKLTIGEWLYKEVKIGKKKIKPSWEGLTEKELGILKKSKKKILVKQGIPFTPAFLFAFVILVYTVKEGMLYLFYSLGI